MADSSACLPRTLEDPNAKNMKPVVIGLYGVPGCGKSFLLKQLQGVLGGEPFDFHEGSEAIAALVPGGLDAFQRLDEQEKLHWRQLAISSIGKKCAESGHAAVVAGHFMFWAEKQETGQSVHTARDLDTYTHILYLDIHPELVADRRHGDAGRSRPGVSPDHLRRWQEAEKTELRRLCYLHNILFLPISSPPDMLSNRISVFLRNFREHDESRNTAFAAAAMDDALAAAAAGSLGKLETVLVFDADKTLAAEDSGTLFWEMGANAGRLRTDTLAKPLPTLFGGPMGYSYIAFRQAVMLFEEAADDEAFDAVCEIVASAVKIHPQIQNLLRRVSNQEHITALIITCGLRRVWEKVLARHGLEHTAKIIGGGRIVDGYVVTCEVKAALVRRMRDVHRLFVWTLGDGVLDLAMFKEAHEAVVVVGESHSRSKSMDSALSAALDAGLRARQVLLPASAMPRLDTTRLPVMELDAEFCETVLRRRPRVLHITGQPGARVLTSLTRDARVAGPALRERHHHIGWFLAVQSLTSIIGVEEYRILHVQGNHTYGHRLYREEQTLIVALMRAGEPMASGVNAAFPLAAFVHAKLPFDIQAHHLKGRHSVILVDAVVNTGKSVVEMVRRIRDLDATIRVVVLAGVVQSQAISAGMLAETLRDPNVFLAALRLSDNMYTGTGGTDTGNRLFNTTYLD